MRTYKAFHPDVELKASDPGAFRATIATYDIVDRDGDVTFKGAMPTGKDIVISAYQHGSWEGELPVGKGTVSEDDHRAYVDGRFFDTINGQDTYKTVKGLGPLQEWSYAYDVEESVGPEDDKLKPFPGALRGLLKLDVHEASPVLKGAGIGTRTDFIKSLMTLPDHAVRALADAKAYVDRELSLADMRTKEGRAISAARRERLEHSIEAFRTELARLEALLQETDPEAGKSAYLAFERSRAELRERGIYI